jgi:hypothetical protein
MYECILARLLGLHTVVLYVDVSTSSYAGVWSGLFHIASLGASVSIYIIALFLLFPYFCATYGAHIHLYIHFGVLLSEFYISTVDTWNGNQVVSTYLQLHTSNIIHSVFLPESSSFVFTMYKLTISSPAARGGSAHFRKGQILLTRGRMNVSSVYRVKLGDGQVST